jgi:hypothetical protein
MTDHEAMLAIQELLDGQIWTAEVLEEIAAVLQQAGYRVRDIDE